MKATKIYSMAAVLAVALMPGALAQTLQKGIDANARGEQRVTVDYVGYRPAVYETEKLSEPENERPNKGGLVYVYLRNVSDKPVKLAFWRFNTKDESHWRLGGFLAWDRVYNENLEPGARTVLEINGVSEDFGPGKPYKLSYVESGAWSPACRGEGVLTEDPVQIALLRVLPGMQEVEVHVRNRGKEAVGLDALELCGKGSKPVQWSADTIDGPGNAIGRIALDAPLTAGEFLIARVGIKTGGAARDIYAHRYAFEDWFPIGVWSNKPDTYEILARLNIDLVVHGGRAEDEFFTTIAPKYGFRTMTGCGKPVNVDELRSLGNHPSVACWMLADEPDWTIEPAVMLFVDRTVRQYNQAKPTFITLCRNVKFFEYAPICDIPCMDHYSVTAPTSSKWPKPYGTYLEETGYYTRDLKRASEPKPIWIWSQAIANWDERPKRNVPTPNELAVQLLQNIGQGAKGIIWFNHEKAAGEKYPDAVQAMAGWGRVMRVTRNDFIGAEPYAAEVKAPEKLDVFALASWDKVLLCITNRDYDIHPEAYPFRTQKDVEITLNMPSWITPACALEIGPDGVKPLACKAKGNGKVRIEAGDIEAARLIVLPRDAAVQQAYEEAYQQAAARETQAF